MSNKKTSTKDFIRQATVGQKKQFVSKIITWHRPVYKDILDSDGNRIGVEVCGVEKEGVEVAVKQPSVGERRKLIKECTDPDTGKVDETKFIVQACILLCFDPQTGENIYTQADFDSLMSQPSGSFVDFFGSEAIKLLTIGDEAENFTTSSETSTSS